MTPPSRITRLRPDSREHEAQPWVIGRSDATGLSFSSFSRQRSRLNARQGAPRESRATLGPAFSECAREAGDAERSRTQKTQEQQEAEEERGRACHGL